MKKQISENVYVNVTYMRVYNNEIVGWRNVYVNVTQEYFRLKKQVSENVYVNVTYESL
jgi:hypothetical protein